MLLRWFITQRDGERVGPFSPLALNHVASDDRHQASSRFRQARMRRPRITRGPSPNPTGPKGNDSE